MLLDNANLCNPTVLDRLNPLLEPRGKHHSAAVPHMPLVVVQKDARVWAV